MCLRPLSRTFTSTKQKCVEKNAVEGKGEQKWKESIKIAPAARSTHPFSIKRTDERGLLPQSPAYFIRSPNRMADPFQT
jgi:hypothetical protein